MGNITSCLPGSEARQERYQHHLVREIEVRKGETMRPTGRPRPPGLPDRVAANPTAATRNATVSGGETAFDRTLNAWAGRGQPEEAADRQTAAARIAAAKASSKKNMTLKLAEMQLTSLPECLDQLTGVTKLAIDHNDLQALPPLPPRLKQLDAGANRLASLPDLPANLRNLEVCLNQLTELPPLPPKLQLLDVARNQLTHLPGPTDQPVVLPPDLNDMDLRWNPLSACPLLPDSLRGFAMTTSGVTNMPYLRELFGEIPEVLSERHVDAIREYQQDHPQVMRNLAMRDGGPDVLQILRDAGLLA